VVWNSAKRLLGIMQQRVSTVLPNGKTRTHKIEAFPDAAATNSGDSTFYPNWSSSARHPVNRAFIEAVIHDV
jgi:hypothetical protein